MPSRKWKCSVPCACNSPMRTSRPIVVVDPDRNYIFANDPACRLVGFDHAEFLQLRIDEIVVGGSQVVQPLFEDFVAEGTQIGTIKLRHRSGAMITVKYEAQVRPDGYMMARWEPIQRQACNKLYRSSFIKRLKLFSAMLTSAGTRPRSSPSA